MKPCAAFAVALLLLSLPIACSRAAHHPASAIEAAAAAREKALQQAHAAAAARDQDRQEIAAIPLPTKSVYLAIHTRQSWANPFLIVGKSSINLSILMPDNGPVGSPGSEVLRPVAARRRVLDIRLSDLPEALAALPESVWPYGRVIAVQEDPLTQKQDRAAMRGNAEASMQVLNDLGIVIDDWSGTGPR